MIDLRKPLLATLALAWILGAPALAQTHTDTGGTVIPGVFSTVDQPFLGTVAMTIGTTYATQRSIGANCTASGSMTITLSDSSIITLPLSIGWQTFPFATSEVNSSTATCTYSNLK